MKLWTFKGEQDSITAALQVTLPDHAVISITGAGGKTSLLFALARELSDAGMRTAVTTTTHMLHPDLMKEASIDLYDGISVVFTDATDTEIASGYPVCPDSELLSFIDKRLDEEGLVMVVSEDPDKPGKVMSPPQWILNHLYKTADAVLIEADGSRCLPLKWPAPWEPAVPDVTDITVCVAGLSALGKSSSDVIYRCEDISQPMRRETVDEKLISAILISQDGGKKNARGEYRVFLNQADDTDRIRAAENIRKVLAVCGIQSAWGCLID